MVRNILAVVLAAGLTASLQVQADDEQTSADVALCGAVYKMSAMTAVDESNKLSFAAMQKRMDKITSGTFGDADAQINAAAFRALIAQLKDARADDEKNGAAALLESRQAFCATLATALPK